MLDIQAELYDAGQPYQELYEAVVELKRRHDLHPCAVHPRDGLSLRSEEERETVQELVSRFRRLPEEAQRKLPALWNSLAQLEIVVGDLDASLSDFKEVARLVSDPISRAEVHHNIYRAALEYRDWDTALAALRRAVALDPETFEPFPFARYEPRAILGAGGLGVSFLCVDQKQGDRKVVVKVLRMDALDREADVLLREANLLQNIDNPGFVDILDMGMAGVHQTEESLLPRPYLVLEYYEGETLTEYVAQHGPLSPDEWLDVAWPIARALQALHHRGLLHRTLRPSAILVRRTRNREGGNRLAVKLLDSGLALRRAVIHASASNPDACRHSGLGRSVARLLAYAPPEVVSRPKGQVWVGPHSDFYSFGRVCAFGLTGRPDPDAADRLLMPEPWQKLLDDCTAWTINRRPSHIGIIIEQLTSMPGADTLIAAIERDLHESTIESLTAQIEADPTNLSARLQRAQAYFRQGDFDEAIHDFDLAIKQKPDDASFFRRRALAHTRAGEPDGAIADYTESLRLEPRNLEALANRGLAHAQKGEHDQAIADYTEGLRLNSRDAILFYNRGNAHYCKGDYQRAIDDYSETLRIDSHNLWGLGNRGKAYLLVGEPARAIADFSRLLQLDPSNIKALCDRASAQLDLGRTDRALADYSEAIRQAPSAALYHDRGSASASAGDFAHAIADFTEALSLSPDNPAYLISRGKAHADSGQFEQAIVDLGEAVRLAPQSVHALIQRADTLARMDRLDEAIADLTQAIELNPREIGVYFQRGNVHARKGDEDRAIADFTEVIRLDDSIPGAYMNRGNSYGRLGEAERALADFDKALSLVPDDPLTLSNRGALHLRLGNLDAALADYQQVIQIDPANARAYHQLGLIHGERGQREQAIADFTEAIRHEPRYSLAWYNRGIALAENEAWEKATTDFTEALRLQPGHLGALINRGIVRRRVGDTEGALADFASAIAADPTFVTAYYNRASLLCERGDLTGALADLDRVIEQAPADVGARLSRGRIHSLLGQHDRALADNLEALTLAPEDPRILNNLAWLWATAPRADLRDPARALEFAQKMMHAGEDANRLDTLAAALAACGRFAEAAETQRRAIDLADEGEKADFRSRLARYETNQMVVQSPIEEPEHGPEEAPNT